LEGDKRRKKRKKDKRIGDNRGKGEEGAPRP
jgi:hypothetical protein